MTPSVTSFDFDAPGALAPEPVSGPTIYTHPDDVVSDPNLTLAEKRAILASWISDARAVENAPALRRLDSGAIVDVDAILRVLVSLGDPNSRPVHGRKRSAPSPRRRSVMTKWLQRIGRPPKNPHDDDDDPPFAPAGFGVPFRPSFVRAYAVPLAPPAQRLACATR
jgi:hypothetical protein